MTVCEVLDIQRECQGFISHAQTQVCPIVRRMHETIFEILVLFAGVLETRSGETVPILANGRFIAGLHQAGPSRRPGKRVAALAVVERQVARQPSVDEIHIAAEFETPEGTPRCGDLRAPASRAAGILYIRKIIDPDARNLLV